MTLTEIRTARFFECGGEEETPFSEEDCRAIGTDFTAAFNEAASMARMSIRLSAGNGDIMHKLPFALTAEAEAFGASVVVNPLNSVPEIPGFKYSSLDELIELPKMNTADGIIRQILQATETLSRNGHAVTVNMEGPFTILSHFVPVKEIYKGLYRKRQRLLELTGHIISELSAYARLIEDAGAVFISYADPAVSYSLISPKLYRDFCGPVTIGAAKDIMGATDRIGLHLCSASSLGLEKVGLCRYERVQVPKGISYGEALIHALATGEGRLYGHGCLQCSHLMLPEDCVYRLNLSE